MSGAEAILVLGVISSIVAIVDGTKQVYDAATNAQGLPKAFREVAGRLPIVMNILLSTKQSIDKGYADENSCKAVKHIVEACEKKAKKLDELFHKAIPAHGASDLKRYYRAVKVLGKGNEVENLMKAMLEDLQLLAYEHGMRIATKAEQDQIVQAITTVSAISPSVPEDVFQETRLTTSNSGPSTETLPQGGTAAQSSSRQDNSIGGHMTSESNVEGDTQRELVLRQPRTPLMASTIPYRRDPDFVVRQTLLDQLHEKSAAPAARIAIVGLGGVGKSQLAIEFSYQVACQSTDTWIFWVHASNAARFKQSYREIADRCEVPGRNDSKADIFQLVNDWLRDGRNGKWLLILDNADDEHWLPETHATSTGVSATEPRGRSTRPLWEYLPQSQHGSILVTSRNRNVALKLVEESDIIPVEPMDEMHAVALFERKLLAENDRKDIVELVTALEFMPLAIVQAATYINGRAPRCSVREYIKKFQKTDKSKTGLLTHEAGHLRRDRDAKNSIITTWEISFDYIQQERPSAAGLLSLMSFFDRQGISQDLLRIEKRQKYNNLENLDSRNSERDQDDCGSETSGSEASNTDDFEDDISMLRNYSFISVNIDETNFRMHRLVQLATRQWLVAHNELERWKQQFIKILSAEFPNGEYETWAKCAALFPHVQLALAQRPEGDDSLKAWAMLLHHAAWYMRLRGSYSDAEKMLLKSIQVKKKVLGEEHLETLNSILILGSIYWDQGRLEEAEEQEVQVLEARTRLLGKEHPDTLDSIYNLASTYRGQGRFDEAEELGVQVMEARKRLLGPEHPRTLNSMHNLGATYSSQGRLEEAEELEVQVMEARKRMLGPEHPDTLQSIHSLGATYWSQERLEEAEELEVQVLEIRKRLLGEEHTTTLHAMNNLAWTWKRQNRDAEALDLMSSCLELSTRKLGPNDPDTLEYADTYNTWKSG